MEGHHYRLLRRMGGKRWLSYCLRREVAPESCWPSRGHYRASGPCQLRSRKTSVFRLMISLNLRYQTSVVLRWYLSRDWCPQTIESQDSSLKTRDIRGHMSQDTGGLGTAVSGPLESEGSQALAYRFAPLIGIHIFLCHFTFKSSSVVVSTINNMTREANALRVWKIK